MEIFLDGLMGSETLEFVDYKGEKLFTSVQE
jgi:hypothetical protein